MSRPPRSLTIALAAFALSIPAVSRAQSTDTPPQTNPGSVSVGLNVGAILAYGAALPVLGPNITFNASRKRALQISTSLTRHDDEYSRETTLLYAVQYRRTIRDEADLRGYWSVGGVGVIYREQYKGYTSPSGYYRTPPSARTAAFPPVGPVAGFGVEKFVRPRLAIRGDVLLSFLVMRAAVGVSVPLGHLK